MGPVTGPRPVVLAFGRAAMIHTSRYDMYHDTWFMI